MRGEVEYLGEFETDEKLPFYNTDAPEAGDGPVRSVIVFRLRPLVKTVTGPAADEVVASTNKVKLEPVEEQYTERAFIEPGREPYEAERRESKLVQAFCQYHGSKGHAVQRLQVLPAGEVKPDFAPFLDVVRMITESPPDIDPRGVVYLRRHSDAARRALLKQPGLQYPDRSIRLHLCEDDDCRKNQKLFSKTSA